MHPDTVKVDALELRRRGYTLREIGQKLDVSHQTIATWCDSPEERAQASQARLQRKFEIDTDLALQAAERVAERIPLMEDKDLTRTYHATTMAVHNTLRIIQDEHKQSSLLDMLRDQLRQRQPGELRTMLTTEDHAATTPGNLGLPALSEPLT